MPLIGFERRDLDKVLGYVSLFAETVYGKEAIAKLPILDSILSIKIEHNRIKKIQELIVRNNYHIPYIDDIRVVLSRIEKADLISEEEAGFIFLNLNQLIAFLDRYLTLNLHAILEYSFIFMAELKDLKSELSKFLTERGKLNPDCSPELKKIMLEKEFLRENIIEKLERLMSSKPNIFQDKYYTIRDVRYVLPLKANFKKEIKAVIRDTSQSGDTLFVEPDIISPLNDKYIFAEKREEIEKRKILTNIKDKIKVLSKEIREGLEFLGYIDSLVARGRYLLKYDLYFPEIAENIDISLYRAYHPLFIDKSNVVKNDLVLSRDKKIFLITGPNGGGKTVAIKTISIILLLTHMAVPTPVSEKSKVPFFKNFCFDMEDRQSIEAGVSSFTSKMLLWREIIKNITSETIVFIDELGNFTNPKEGTAISIAFLDHLVSKKGIVVSGTHIDEIKEYVSSRKDGIVSSMLWDDNEQKPLYKISYGFYSGSFAIEVLKKLGYEEDFIRKCENNLANDYIYIEEIKKKREREYVEVLRLKEHLEESKKEIETIKKERELLLKKIEEEKYGLLSKYTKEIEELKRKIEENMALLPKDRKLAREFYKAISSESYGVLKKLKEFKVTDLDEEPLKVGDEVFIMSINERGKIIAIDGDNYNVLTKNLKIWIDSSVLKKVDKDSSKRGIKKEDKDSLYREKIDNLQIDVRGKRVDDALILIDKFLDRALLAGADTVKVIHGAGEGKLRESIHKFLKTSPVVNNYRVGSYIEPGGSYYTIIELKK